MSAGSRLMVGTLPKDRHPLRYGITAFFPGLQRWPDIEKGAQLLTQDSEHRVTVKRVTFSCVLVRLVRTFLIPPRDCAWPSPRFFLRGID